MNFGRGKFQSIGPAQSTRIYEKAAEIGRNPQLVQQRPRTGCKVSTGIEHALRVIAEIQLQPERIQQTGFEHFNHGLLLFAVFRPNIPVCGASEPLQQQSGPGHRPRRRHHKETVSIGNAGCWRSRGAMHREIFESGQTHEPPQPKIVRLPRLTGIHTTHTPHQVHFAPEAAN